MVRALSGRARRCTIVQAAFEPGHLSLVRREGVPLDQDGKDDRSDPFKSRLKAARASQAERAQSSEQDGRGKTGQGGGFGHSLELVVGTLVGAFMGFWIDRWLGTLPLFLIGLGVLGFAAGVRNLLRATGKDRAEPGVDQTHKD